VSPLSVGVDLGGTHIRAVAFDDDFAPVARASAPTGADEGVDAVIGRMADCVRATLAEAGTALDDLSGVGVGAAGLVDWRSGTVLLASNLGWRDVPLRDLLGAALGDVAVRVDMDTNAAALAEVRLGAGRGRRHLLYVTVGTGVGGAEVLDGRLYRGASGGAGQIGHVVVDPSGPRCGCGGQGCVEVYASGAGIVARARERGFTVEDLTTEAVFRAAEQGDRAATAAIGAGADALGRALATYVNLNNPEAIIVGGGVADASPGYRERARRSLEQGALPPLAEIVEVLPAGLDGDAGAIGGALLLSEETDDGRVDR
jgi:glucokinase